MNSRKLISSVAATVLLMLFSSCGNVPAETEPPAAVFVSETTLSSGTATQTTPGTTSASPAATTETTPTTTTHRTATTQTATTQTATTVPETTEPPEEPLLLPVSADPAKVYYLTVNTECNTITVYRRDAQGNYSLPVKAMICSTGGYTPKDTVITLDYKGKWPWLLLMGNVWGRYCTQIDGDILFHSVPYLAWSDKSSLKYGEFDKLGTTCSMGCIRLVLEDAIWIYIHKSNIAAVEFYSSSSPGPLGKPEAPTVSENETCRGWDPSDPDPQNPWHSYPQD